MGKTLTAAQMLNAGRKRPPTPAETGTEPLDNQASTSLDAQTSEPLDNQASTNLDAQTSEPLDNQATSAVDHQATKPLGTQLVERVNAAPTDRRGNQSSKRLSTHSEQNGQPSATYQRVTVFLTPAQRQWLKLTAKQLPDGLSASDIVRLAVGRLTLDVTDGLDLVTNLTDQAHSDAEIFSGRRNRGLPPRADISA